MWFIELTLRLDFWNHLQFNLELEKPTKKTPMYEINNSNLTLSPLLKIFQGLKATETSFVPTSSGSGGVGGSSTKRNKDKCKSKGIFRNYVIFKCSWDGKSGKSNAK